MLAMQEYGLDFRATKDLDIVLFLEAMDDSFLEAFWGFVEIGRYKYRHMSTNRETFYRFSDPEDQRFPAILELFSRSLHTIEVPPARYLTPISMPDTELHLSAILLDQHYYDFIHSGKAAIGGFPCICPTHLIPLKARAWIDLQGRKESGEAIDSRDIKKHRNDIFRLGQLLSVADSVELPPPIERDMNLFLAQTRSFAFDLKPLNTHQTIEEIATTLQRIYNLPSDIE